MENNKTPVNNDNNQRERNTTESPARSGDIQDPARDRTRLKPDETTIDLPEVKDIPGQEFIHAPNLGMLADTTASSADEEADDLLDDDEDLDMEMDTRANVTRDEKIALANADEMLPTQDDNNLIRASMDSTDFEGTPLNERSFGQERSGSDLDIQSNNDERTNERTGGGDEENKHYSLGSADNDNVTEGTP